MKLSPEQYREILQRPGMQKANPALGGVSSQEHKPKSRPALVKNAPRRQSGQASLDVIIRIVAVRNFYCDEDNSRTAYKPLQDAIAKSLGVDDGADCIRFEYGQLYSPGPEGTIVVIQTV